MLQVSLSLVPWQVSFQKYQLKKKVMKTQHLSTVEPRLKATLLIRPPRYYGHSFWLPGENRHTFSCKKKPH